MAIIGNIEDILKQITLSENLQKGLEYLQDTNLDEIFDDIENGKSKVVEINDKTLFAVFSKYETRVNTPPVFEGHRKYIDIQFITKGEEQILVTSGAVSYVGIYSDENDCQLCESQSYSRFLLTPGIAAILFPEDWHAPGQQSVNAEKILKIVVKVAI